ncbi:MAG: hypothetical protein IPL33_07250 [Sphingobacteriales bacterium]|nr:hypothetical protein [Sphingobacteriales bacterium]
MDYVPEADIYTNAPPIPAPAVDEYRICAGDAVNFQALQPGIDYEWQFVTVTGGPAPVPTTYGPDPINLYDQLNNIVFANVGTYTIRHRVKSDCCGWSAWVEITLHVAPIPDFDILPQPAYLCGTDTISLTVTLFNPTDIDPSSYLWTPAIGLSDPTSLTPQVTNLGVTTTYTFLAYNTTGNCYHEENVTVNVSDALSLSATITPPTVPPTVVLLSRAYRMVSAHIAINGRRLYQLILTA